jgi:hypothetical protein
MSDESVVENLLGSIPQGGEVKDPREGDHYDAKFSDVELAEQTNGHVVKLTFEGLRDVDGREFTYQERVTIPTSNSELFIQRIFLAIAHDLGVLPRTQKNAFYADTDEHRAVVLAAFEAVKGTSAPLNIRTDGKGFLRGRIIRSKKAA